MPVMMIAIEVNFRARVFRSRDSSRRRHGGLLRTMVAMNTNKGRVAPKADTTDTDPRLVASKMRPTPTLGNTASPKTSNGNVRRSLRAAKSCRKCLGRTGRLKPKAVPRLRKAQTLHTDISSSAYLAPKSPTACPKAAPTSDGVPRLTGRRRNKGRPPSLGTIGRFCQEMSSPPKATKPMASHWTRSSFSLKNTAANTATKHRIGLKNCRGPGGFLLLEADEQQGQTSRR